MSPLVRFIILRLMLFPLTLFIVTATLMAMLSITPPEIRVLQYLPHRVLDNLNEMDNDQLHAATERYIEEYHTDDPFPMQYAYWLVNVFTQGGGISPNLKGEVFSALLSKTAVTAELTLYALLLFIPLGIVSGLRAGWEQGGLKDLRFRTAAYIATSLPPYIVALVLIDIFYMFLGWFPPGRLGIAISQEVLSPDFQKFTGLLTIDSLLNWRLDIFIDSIRHLVLPVCALSLMYWATLGRIVRSTIITEREKDYITAARSRGIPENRLLWRHALPNVLAPALSSSALAAASLFSGVFVIEIIFDLKGVADLVVGGVSVGLDVPIVMGFSVYSVCVVLVIMFILDVLRIFLDPRSPEGMSYDEAK